MNFIYCFSEWLGMEPGARMRNFEEFLVKYGYVWDEISDTDQKEIDKIQGLIDKFKLYDRRKVEINAILLLSLIEH